MLSRTAMLRLLVFVAVAVHMELGGLFEQVLHRARPPTTMTWRMYASTGVGVCEVRWFRMTPEGKLPVDRLTALGHADLGEASDAVKLLDGAADVWNAGKALCAELGEGTDLRVEARCGSRPGGAWFVPVDDGVDICNPANAPALGPRGKARAKGKRRTSAPGAEPTPAPIADVD